MFAEKKRNNQHWQDLKNTRLSGHVIEMKVGIALIHGMIYLRWTFNVCVQFLQRLVYYILDYTKNIYSEVCM